MLAGGFFYFDYCVSITPACYRVTMKKPLVKKPEGRNRGRVKLNITPEVIAEAGVCAEHGMTHKQIAEYFGLSKTGFCNILNRHPEMRAEIMKGRAKTTKFVVTELLKLISEKNIRAMEIWLNRVNWGGELDDLNLENSNNAVTRITEISTNDPMEAARIYKNIMIG